MHESVDRARERETAVVALRTGHISSPLLFAPDLEPLVLAGSSAFGAFAISGGSITFNIVEEFADISGLLDSLNV